MKLQRWSLKRLSLLTIAGLLFVSTWWAKPSLGAVPQLDTIRVAIFLQLPGKYQVNTAAATFASAGGLTIGMSDPAGVVPWLNIGANEQSRIAKDDYKVKVVETESFDTALGVYKRLQALSGSGFITSLKKKGKTVYQVAEGTYGNAADATAAMTKWTADSTISKLTGGTKAAIQGPFHLESATTYASEAEAVKASEAFSSAGVDAFVGVRKAEGSSNASYSVFVGAAASTAELNVVKTAAGAAGSGLKTAEDSAYLLERNDHTLTGKADNAVTLYAFPINNAKVRIMPAADKPIKLTERSSRTYRGQFEVSEFNGKLAVINELPFEQYLYSVVGGEMIASWPLEALKAQAVSARTYALYQGFGFQIANVVDSVSSQEYQGTTTEKPSTIQAVDETAGEVMLYNGKLIEALFSSNGGGKTADASEIWGNSVAYLKSVSSPTDSSSEKGLYSWYRVVLPDNNTGYIREDLLTDSGQTNAAGIKLMTVNTDGSKVRKNPKVEDSVSLVGQVNKGTIVAILDKTVENNAMSWVKGPFTSSELLATMTKQASVTGPITSLQVGTTGPSGRATQLLVNGQPYKVKYPDVLRSALGGLPSTLFKVDETAKVTMLGANGSTRTKTSSSQPVYMIQAGGKVSQADGNVIVMNGDSQIRATTKDPSYRFVGSGNGHGIGLSQYGALGLAQQGYDYSYILQYYYKDVTIAKE
ncbi:stage II sporulation protein D [Paenibacillus catalpae]|uniref:Stage II sporulation protein D n=1 Tax=Paenibacillus catalpae TaxID=1045775 RepID=A0A1I1Z3B6_9BACL|nr:SpoIID/LytB domain-containing protein [Paenibacillus catalpae]SFE24830.1 stage II sporulation protein D [Paenibacillus catalpae]